MSSKGPSVKSNVAKKPTKKKAPTMKDEVKMQRPKRGVKNQQEVKDSEMTKSGREPDVETVTEECDVDVENVPSNANIVVEIEINAKQKTVPKKRGKVTKGQILETEATDEVRSDETTEEKMTASNGSDPKKRAKANKNKKSEDVTNDDEGTVSSKGKPKNVQPKKKAQKPQPSNADDASSNEEKPTTVENLEMPKQKPKKTKDVKKTKEVSQPSNAADDGKAVDGDSEMTLSKEKPKKTKQNKKNKMAQPSTDGNSEVVSATKKSKEDQPSNAGSTSPNEEMPQTDEVLDVMSATKKPKKGRKNQKAQPPNADDNSNDEMPQTNEDLIVVSATQKPKKGKNNQKAQLPNAGNTSPNEETSQIDEDLVVVAATKIAKKSKKIEKAEMPKPSSTPAIDEDSDLVLTKGKPKKAKPNEKAQTPQTSNLDDVSPDDNLEVQKLKIKKTSQTKDDRKVNPSSKKEEKAAKPPNKSILQLKITLQSIDPPIWRRIQVLNNDTFYNLHEHIKRAMGWMYSASHQFITTDSKKKSSLLIVDGSLGGLTSERHLLKGQTTKLSKFLNAKDDHILFEFDFGEYWTHDVTVEKVLPPPGPKAQYPKCTGGQRACPPTDCGGIDGYNHLLEVYKNPNHSEYEELIVNWLERQNPGWDPEMFDRNKFHSEDGTWVGP